MRQENCHDLSKKRNNSQNRNVTKKQTVRRQKKKRGESKAYRGMGKDNHRMGKNPESKY